MRWEICFNLSVLRMLSYALDLHWRKQLASQSQHQRGGSRRTPHDAAKAADKPTAAAHSKAVCAAGPAGAAAQCRQQAPLPSDGDYGLLPYLAYILYAPLYLAGPIITFQDFAWQLRRCEPPRAREVGICFRSCRAKMDEKRNRCYAAFLPTRADSSLAHEHTFLQILHYAARLAADWACLELLTHCLYFNSVAKHRIGLRYRQYGLQYGTTEMGKCHWEPCASVYCSRARLHA